MRIVDRKVYPKDQIVVYAADYLGNLTSLVEEYNKTMKGKMSVFYLKIYLLHYNGLFVLVSLIITWYGKL